MRSQKQTRRTGGPKAQHIARRLFSALVVSEQEVHSASSFADLHSSFCASSLCKFFCASSRLKNLCSSFSTQAPDASISAPTCLCKFLFASFSRKLSMQASLGELSVRVSLCTGFVHASLRKFSVQHISATCSAQVFVCVVLNAVDCSECKYSKTLANAPGFAHRPRRRRRGCLFAERRLKILSPVLDPHLLCFVQVCL